MTGTRTNLRGVFLAALMVISVFAVASPAAAAVATADRTVGSDSVTTSGTVTVTDTATMDADGGAITINESFSGAVQSASIQSVTVNGQSVDPVVSAANANGAVVTVSSTGSNATVTVTYQLTAANNTGTISITGEVTGGGQTVDLGTASVSVVQGTADIGMVNNSLSVTSPVDVNETFTLTATVANNGSASGTATVQFMYDSDGDNTLDSVLAETNVTLRAGEQVTLSYSLAFATAGEIAVGVGIEGTQDYVTGFVTVEQMADLPPFHSYDYDEKLTSGGLYWQGQDLLFDAGSSYADTTWRLYEANPSQNTAGDFVTEIDLDENATHVLDTSDLQGDYVLRDQNGNTVAFQNGNVSDGASVQEAYFTVSTQNLQASLSKQSVKNDGADTTVDLTLTSKRGDYSAYVNVEGGNASLAELNEAFSAFDVVNATDSDEYELKLQNLPPTTTQTLDFSGVTAADYNITFAVTDTDAKATVSLDVKQPKEGDASYTQSVFSVERGDIAEFTVSLESRSTAEIYVGSQKINFLANATITDGDDNGKVTVLFNTYQTGPAESADMYLSAKDSDDSVAATEIIGVETPLSVAAYNLNVSIDSQTAGVAVVNIQPTDAVSSSGSIAPDAKTLDTRSKILDASTAGSVVAHGDQIIYRVDVSGIEGASSLDAAGVNVTMTETTVGPNQNAVTYTEDDLTNIVTDLQNDTVYFVWDTSQVQMQQSPEKYNVTFSIDAADNLVYDDDVSVTRDFTIEEPTLSITGLNASGVLTVPAVSNVTITGTTNLAPGSTVSMQIMSSTTGVPYLMTVPKVTVSADGTFSATFDFAEYAKTTFDLSVTGPLQTSADVEGYVQVAQPTTTTQQTTTTTQQTTTTTQQTTTTTQQTTTTTQETTTTTQQTTTTTQQQTTTQQRTPGFGVAVSLLALIGAALVALRRRN